MKSSLPPLKHVIDRWTCPRTTSVYIKKKLEEWLENLRFPQGLHSGLHYPLSWSNRFWGGRKRFSCYNVSGSWQRIRLFLLPPFCPNVYMIVTSNEGKKKGRRSNKKKILKIVLLGHIIENSAHPLLGAWSLLLVDIWFTPSKGSKGFKKLDHGSMTMGKCPLTWDNFMVHDVSVPKKWVRKVLQNVEEMNWTKTWDKTWYRWLDKGEVMMEVGTTSLLNGSMHNLFTQLVGPSCSKEIGLHAQTMTTVLNSIKMKKILGKII